MEEVQLREGVAWKRLREQDCMEDCMKRGCMKVIWAEKGCVSGGPCMKGPAHATPSRTLFLEVCQCHPFAWHLELSRSVEKHLSTGSAWRGYCQSHCTSPALRPSSLLVTADCPPLQELSAARLPPTARLCFKDFFCCFVYATEELFSYIAHVVYSSQRALTKQLQKSKLQQWNSFTLIFYVDKPTHKFAYTIKISKESRSKQQKNEIEHNLNRADL